jgi:hypothetical protein
MSCVFIGKVEVNNLTRMTIGQMKKIIKKISDCDPSNWNRKKLIEWLRHYIELSKSDEDTDTDEETDEDTDTDTDEETDEDTDTNTDEETESTENTETEPECPWISKKGKKKISKKGKCEDCED